MNRSGVPYILLFCVAICLVCAVVVSSAAVGLKEQQEVNKQLDRQKKVLGVAGLMAEGAQLTQQQVESMYIKRIKPIVIELKSGQEDAEATKSAANFDQLKRSKDPATSKPAPKNLAGVRRVPNQALVFLVSSKDMAEDGSGFELSQYIFPVEGKGLWSTLYGYVALKPDFNEVRGLTFYQHAETPGLGGEVDNPGWKAKWPGRYVFGPKGTPVSKFGKVKLKVIKGSAGTPEKAPHAVDGLSGATITSNGVSHLLSFWLGKNGYAPYISKVAAAAGGKE